MQTAFRVNRRLPGRLALFVLGGALALAATGCGQVTDGGTGSGAGGAGASSTDGAGGFGGAPDGAATGSPAAEPTTGPTGKPGGDDGGNSGGDQNPSAHPTTSAPTGPTLVYFRVKQKPQCPQGTSKYPVPAVPLVIEWKVTGTDQVTLSVDGPGVYNTYGAQGTESFTFSCGGPVGSTEKHTYLIKAEHDGVTRSKTISASAVVNEIPQV
ncbi:MAG TPA: hypothetical protein VGD43_03210 [Micromonospora sp.]